ncbi:MULTISPECIES: hypothetical protein [Mammaliicoccus]|uniref:hypothetical protein n=1 Tax=Mammaliicoccus sp. JADD-157 TaxID=3404818 RepID=UPI0028E3A88E|nr:hypothetical protein [Mammaliicoccus lentus]
MKEKTNINEEIISFFKENGYEVPNIPINRKYWLVRTEGGDWFEQFSSQNYIGVGWNEISDEKYLENVNKKQAINILNSNYPDKSQHSHTLNIIKKFYKEMSIGDIVMIPSVSSQTIKFGVITSEVKILKPTETEIDEGSCPYFKRRDVKWVKTINKNSLDLKLFKMLQSRHTISNANDYANEIDSSLYDFYVKGETVNMSILVNKERNLSAYSLKTLTNLPWTFEKFMKGVDYDLKELESKIYIRSRGKQELIAKGKNGVKYTFYSALIMIALVGGKLEVQGLTVETKGALQPLLESLLNHNVEHNRHVEQTNDHNQEDLKKLRDEVWELKNQAEIKAPELPKTNKANEEDEEIDETDIY